MKGKFIVDVPMSMVNAVHTGRKRPVLWAKQKFESVLTSMQSMTVDEVIGDASVEEIKQSFCEALELFLLEELEWIDYAIEKEGWKE